MVIIYASCRYSHGNLSSVSSRPKSRKQKSLDELWHFVLDQRGYSLPCNMISNMHKNNLMNSPFSFSYGLIVLM